MKLDDIDLMISQRSEYHRARTEYKAACSGVETIVLKGRQINYAQHRELFCKVQMLLRDDLLVKLNDQKTRLMMMGITEFPD